MNPLKKSLIYEFLSTLIIETDNGFKFSKYEILNNLDLLKSIAKDVAKLVSPDVDCICTLAMSGIPIGVAVARELNLPIIFYSRDAWEDDPDIGDQKILAHPPKNSVIAIIDTHVRTGGNSFKCCKYLKDEFNLNVLQIISPFDFECRTDTVLNVEYSSLGYANEYKDILCELLDTPNFDDLKNTYLSVHSDFWDYPKPRRPIDTSKFRKASRLWGLPRLLPKPISIGQEIKKEIIHKVPIDHINIWNFFLDPSLVKKVIKKYAETINFNNYSGLVGIEALGAALSIWLGLEINYDKPIFFFINEYGLFPQANIKSGSNLGLMQVRLSTGRFAVEAAETVINIGGQVSNVFAVRTDLGLKFLSLGKLSLHKLDDMKIKIFSID